jgi:hypothetical protein
MQPFKIQQLIAIAIKMRRKQNNYSRIIARLTGIYWFLENQQPASMKQKAGKEL